MPAVTKVEPPHPPLPPHALGFGNGGRERRFSGAQRARGLLPWRHWENGDDVPVLVPVTPPSCVFCFVLASTQVKEPPAQPVNEQAAH